GAALCSPGSVTTVKDVVGTDGTDTLRNIEVLQFGGATTPPVTTTTPGGPTDITAVGGPAQATVAWIAPDVKHAGPAVVTGYQVEVDDVATGAIVGPLRPAGPAANSLEIPDLAPGSYRFRVQAVNSAATPPEGPFSVSSNAVSVTPAVAPDAPVIGIATGGRSSAALTWAVPASDGGSAVTGYSVRVVDAATNAQIGALQTAAADATSVTVGGLVNGTAVSFQVQARNGVGTGGFSALSNTVTPATVPAAPVIGAVTRGSTSALVTWAAPASNGGSAVTGYSVRVLYAASGLMVGALRPAAAGTTSLRVTGLVNGSAVRFQVLATNAVDAGAFSAASAAVTPAGVPGRTRIGVAADGADGGHSTALVRWRAPVSDGGLAVKGYLVTAVRISRTGVPGARYTSAAQPAQLRSLSMTLPAGYYRFTVRARNVLGLGASSASSNLVKAQ
ncbi:MAG: fibronectin type III domain-containing protein, partial [Marmoricola sp.]